MIQVSRQRAVLLGMAAFLLAGMCSAAESSKRSGRSRRYRDVTLTIGQEAPDFELHPLVFTKNEAGELVGMIGTEKVQLSSFRGKAPVCIFSSSYT